MLRVQIRPRSHFGLGQGLPGGLVYQPPTYSSAFSYGMISGLGNAIGIALGLAIAGSFVGRAISQESEKLIGRLTGLVARR